MTAIGDNGGTNGKTVFVFSGQGSYSPALLRDIYTSYPLTRPYFQQADEATRRFLDCDFLPLVTASSQEEHDERLKVCPDLDQIGIYLGSVLTAQVLMQAGVKPDLLVGHSFGELAALATAGVYGIETGLRIVCQRVISLQSLADAGRMAALSCDGRRAKDSIETLGESSLEISVLNHARQTVVSGTAADLDRLTETLARRGISTTLLKSRYPYHSSHLRRAVKVFAAFLKSYEFAPASTPVLLSMEGRLYTPDCDLAQALSSQFVRPLDFSKVVATIYDDGHRHFIECGGADIVTRVIKQNLAGKADIIARSTAEALAEIAPLPAAPDVRVAPNPRISGEECSEIPIAIVSMGCVLPGAGNPEEFWQNVVEGKSGIVNLADAEPAAASDFLVGDGAGQVTIVPDKTYTLLHGSIVDLPYDAALLSDVCSEAEFSGWPKSQRLLALALKQSLSRLTSKLPAGGPDRIQCILGSTADGCKEYDDALFNESLHEILATLEEPENLRRPFAAALEEMTGYKLGASRSLTQHTQYRAVLEKFLHHPIKTYVIDVACSSSLYSICLGMKALQDGESDLVFTGGVFAPGAANNALFAQFRGLTPRESRPLDSGADGVVFGDGAGIAILKRLPDALADGDKIIGVIRGVGLSSDGKSPSINVPKSDGQAIAIRRAYERAGVPIDTIQYVEAHATATPVGDAVEFNALSKAFSTRDPALPAVQLASVKALIGHTGWTAGVASVIKLCKAFEARLVPKQYHYTSPSREIDLAHSPFAIASASSPWPENIQGYPRRAGINGFGFGGTNAHLVLEAFDPDYHQGLRIPPVRKERGQETLAIVGVGNLFPQSPASAGEKSTRRFTRGELKLPRGKMLLPDVTEHMDASQYLAGMAAEAVFATMPTLSARLKGATGIVLGLASKTARGVAANERIFLDRLRRRFADHGEIPGVAPADAKRILDKLVDTIIKRNPPSGPYTLPGLMPNVAAGRIANLFDLNGPNIVVDMADRSLLQAISIAHQLLTHGDCELALAGGISANAGNDSERAEAAVLMALTTAETARREGLPVLGTLTLSGADGANNFAQPVPVMNPDIDYCGASGAPEIAWALEHLGKAGARHIVLNPAEAEARALLFASATPAADEPKVKAAAPGAYSYVQGTPICCYEPLLAPAAADKPAKSLKGRHIVFLADQPELWNAIEESGALAGLDYKIICPAGVRIANSIAIDLESDDSARTSLAALSGIACDTLIAVKSLKGRAADTLLVASADSELAWIDLLFAACRHYYEQIGNKNVSVVSLCLDAHANGRLDPYTGLVSGFMKSLAREMPDGVCRIVSTDAGDFGAALRLAEIELGQSSTTAADDVCYVDGARHVVRLSPVAAYTSDEKPYLDSNSVVIATGGGRGVTATLAEQLLKDFGCRVIAIGRTEPASMPDEMRGMDDEALKKYEATFYQERLRSGVKAKIPDLKREYLGYRAAKEVCDVTQELQAIGKYEYRSINLTDEVATEAFVEEVYRDHRRVDLVLHGAGIQISKMLTKKSLGDFRRIIATKLNGLSNLYKACERRRQGNKVHYHLLTSAFSYVGNDGQSDYGAANEAMNRLAVAMNGTSSSGTWSSLAWLGWAGIGMTRDSEFAALAASRGLRGVTKSEGQELFSRLMRGTPTTPANILLAPGEIDYYKVQIEAAAPNTVSPVAAAARSAPDTLLIERSVSIRTDPYLLNHRVDGVPTVPGAHIISLVAEAAQQLRPDLKIVSFERAHFHRFIKVYGNRETPFRVHANIVSENDAETLVRVRLLADFIHRSGAVLQKDILQHEIEIRMASALRHSSPHGDLGRLAGRPLSDPYVMEGSPVNLSGPFKTMSNIIAGDRSRRADYKLACLNGAGIDNESSLPKIMLMDSLWRFGAIEVGRDGSLPIHVPEKCDLMKMYFDFPNVSARRLMGTLTLSGANPRAIGDMLHIGPVAAYDSDGNLLLSVEGGLCRQLGEVRNGFAFQATGT
jgi:acyl transferase domain-containing protein